MTNTNVFDLRRRALGERYSRTLFIIPSGEQAMRSHSVGFKYKVPSDFMYLVGLEIPGAVLVLRGSVCLLLKQRSKASVWDDVSLDDRSAGAITVDSADRLEDVVRSQLGEVDRVACPIGRNRHVDLLSVACIAYARGRRLLTPLALVDSRSLTGTLRLTKDENEIVLMREAARRSSRVHRGIMELSFVDKSEEELSWKIEAGFLAEGMQWTAYETIVGSGPRATLLHARPTKRVMNQGELVVVDAGGEFEGYCADITRTLPVGARFTEEQKKLYQVVLGAQKQVIQAVAPGMTLQDLNTLAQESLRDGLSRQGFTRPSTDRFNLLMPHSTSHWIGMDVHDPAPQIDDSGAPILLAPGMCFTVEPGLYFRDKWDEYASLINMGCRIEDDIVVTAKGCELLSDVPKEVEEIEALRAML
jgi:Xaa-Pro aminopeptidase